LNGWVRDAVQPGWGALPYQLALLASFGLIGSLLDAPFEIWETFRIEQRFGFNRMTWKLYLADALKGLVVATLIGLPLAALVLWLMASAGAWFQLLMLLLYPTVIAPLFNKFEPLADTTLAERVKALMTRCGFAAKGLFVMDGSRRSAHSNAYFTGLGAAKRVVFYDTLLKRLSATEVEAVLAHELGHFKLRHVPKRMASMFLLSLAFLALLLLMMALPPFGFLVTPLAAALSRKQEFEADAYACAQADGQALASALVKLHEDNAGTLTPDPVYAKFYYSHPPAAERLAALKLQPAL
jgi:STE24 endopeptidase